MIDSIGGMHATCNVTSRLYRDQACISFRVANFQGYSAEDSEHQTKYMKQFMERLDRSMRVTEWVSELAVRVAARLGCT